MSNVCSAVTLELPKSNRFWSDERLKKFLTDHDMQKFADCAACAMVWKPVRDSLLVKSFALHVRIKYLPQVLERDFSVNVLRGPRSIESGQLFDDGKILI